MKYDRGSRELDLRLEADDLSLERVSECLHYCETACKWPVDIIVIRGRQKNSLMKDGAVLRSSVGMDGGPRSDLGAVFGTTIVEREDGLTPRQRSVMVALADLPPTRAEQVAEYLRGEIARFDPPLDPPLSASEIPF